MPTIKVNRQVEKITVPGDDGEAAIVWKIRTDDKSMDSMLKMVGNAIDRAQALTEKSDEAQTEEELAETNRAIVHLQKRVISAIVGADGYDELLLYIGGGKPADPAENIVNIGDVFGALCVWLYERCTAKQLREAGVMFQGERERTQGQWMPDNRASRRKKKSK
jgi:hypothetical protein